MLRHAYVNIALHCICVVILFFFSRIDFCRRLLASYMLNLLINYQRLVGLKWAPWLSGITFFFCFFFTFPSFLINRAIIVGCCSNRIGHTQMRAFAKMHRFCWLTRDKCSAWEGFVANIGYSRTSGVSKYSIRIVFAPLFSSCQQNNPERASYDLSPEVADANEDDIIPASNRQQ